MGILQIEVEEEDDKKTSKLKFAGEQATVEYRSSDLKIESEYHNKFGPFDQQIPK